MLCEAHITAHRPSALVPYPPGLRRSPVLTLDGSRAQVYNIHSLFSYLFSHKFRRRWFAFRHPGKDRPTVSAESASHSD